MTQEEEERYMHNLNIMYQRIQKGTMVKSVPEILSDYEAGCSLYVYEGTTPINIDDNDFDQISELSKRARSLKRAIILDIGNSIQYENDIRISSSIMPSYWIKEILPLILTDTQRIWEGYLVEDFEDCLCDVGKDDIIIEFEDNVPNSIIYTNAKRTRIYFQDKFELAYITMINKLLDLYKKGSIANVDDGFISRWELIEEEYKGVYHPSWENRLVAREPTKFLLDQKMSPFNNNTYQIESRKVRSELNNITPTFA